MSNNILISGQRINALTGAIRDKKNISVFGMPFYPRLIALAGLDSFLYVCPDYVKAAEAFEQIKSIRDDAVYLPAMDDVLLTAKYGSATALARFRALYALAQGRAKVAVTTVLGFMQLYPLKSDILSNTVVIRKGDTVDAHRLSRRLALAGYKRVTQVENTGEFAMRGGILDVSPVGMETGVRIDFFGDEAEQIRLMDFDSQLSSQETDSVEICPASEVFFDEALAAEATAKIKVAIPKSLDPAYRERILSLADDLTQRLEGGITDGVLNCIKPLLNQISLSEFFSAPISAPIIFDEAKQCADNFTAHLSEHRSRFKTLLARGEAFEFGLQQLSDTLVHKNSQNVMAAFDKLLCQNRIFAPQEVFNFKDPELLSYAKNTQGFIDDIKMWRQRGLEIRIYCLEPLKSAIAGVLSENSISPSILKDGALYRGGCFFDENVIIIGNGDLTFKKRKKPAASKKAAFFQPKVGEYVVHDVHGIGMCEGLKRMNMGGAERDFVVVRYEGGDLLYVAVESLNLISAYAGEEDVKLNKIGGAEFARFKEKAKKSIREMAFDLSRLYAEREGEKGHAYSPDHAALSEFEADFPYEETPCQLAAIEDGLKDLVSGKIMDRLLCGDVGYGKTEVAMRLAYKVVLEGKQVAFVSPTTILARQHYNTLSKRMEKFGVSVAPLTRFESAQSVNNTLESLQKGGVDIICGTHRVLSKDVAFKDLGLLVLDEEQRFGVADKEKIKLLKTDVNVLSLSATPIPRTLHMAMSGIRDISVLTTPPPSRIPVSTYVCEYTESLVFDAITRESGRGGQSFIVYNRVEKIDAFANTIIKLFPALRVAIAHGQMPQSRLENTVNEFAAGNIDILVTSTIIENGIDMANVNTMIVADADRLGLSQLYQLRGRIGRGDKLAYAFFTFDGNKTLTENAYKRLEAISGYTEFGSGFKLAMRDLEIRGAGNVLGREQHGHMQKVGYDMYLRLIREVMDELKGVKTEQQREAKVIADFAAFIPDAYIPDIEWRLKAYKRIAEVETEDESTGELKELKDIYGEPPLSVKNLVLIALIKNLAQKAGADRVLLTHKECGLKFGANSDIPLELVKKAVNEGFLYSAAEASLMFRPKPDAPKKLLKFLLSAAKQ